MDTPAGANEGDEEGSKWSEYLEQISRYGRSLEDTIEDQFRAGIEMICVGENHSEASVVHDAIQKSLKRLVQSGIKPVIYMEVDRNKQGIIDSLDLDLPEDDAICYLIVNGIKPYYRTLVHIKTMIFAKKLGLRVVFIDDPEDTDCTNNIKANERERRMFDTIETNPNIDGSGMVIVGTEHVSKQSLHGGIRGKIQRLGTILFEKLGLKMVSIRYASSCFGIDGTDRNLPIPADLYPGIFGAQPKGVIAMPDKGLFQGDRSRGVCSDYVIVPTNKL